MRICHCSYGLTFSFTVFKLTMITQMETLPNEILLRILSHLLWFDVLTSFWSLNIRFDSLVCSTLSINTNRFNEDFLSFHGVSYNKCCSILSLISHSPLLCSSVRNIHFDGSNANSYDHCYSLLFDAQHRLRFPNLKSVAFTHCGSIEPMVRSLLYLVEHQLDELILTFDQRVFGRFDGTTENSFVTSGSKYKNLMESEYRNLVESNEGRQKSMAKELLRQIFSEKCQLKYLRLDISKESRCGPLHECFLSEPSSYSIPTHVQSHCVTLRQIDIRLYSTWFLQCLIEHVPNLEQLSVDFVSDLLFHLRNKCNANWWNKLPKLKRFSLKTWICEDREFIHLKWLLNNVNYVENLEVCLRGYKSLHRDLERIWQSSIDANFVRQYCLPDTIVNLIQFNFYIGSVCQSAVDGIEQRINSFRNHPLFHNHQWNNVKYVFDPIRLYQHVFSDFPHSRFGYSIASDWRYSDGFNIPACPSLHFLLEQLSPKISSIRTNEMPYDELDESDLRQSSQLLFKLKQRMDTPFRHVTKIRFGRSLNLLRLPTSRKTIERDPIRENVLAQLFSLAVQLKYLHIEQFEWLLHVTQYACDELRPNALHTVQYVEFYLPSCHTESNERIRVGKHLLSLLTTHMPQLRTLRLWRWNDFPWTSIRPDFSERNCDAFPIYRWMRSLRTEKSIVRHVAVFEQDICQLFEQMKELTYLDISGKIDCVKIEPYHSMARIRFPDSRLYVDKTRFRLWR